MNGQEKLDRQPELPADTASEDAALDAARLLDAARAGLGAGPDGQGWPEKLDVDPALGEQAVREAAAEVLRARLDARFARPGTAEKIWNRAKAKGVAPGIERRCDADTFFADSYLFTSRVIGKYRAGEGYWATGRGHLFPVRPGPFGFEGWIISNIDGAARRVRRGEEIGGDSPAGRKFQLVPVDPTKLAESHEDPRDLAEADGSYGAAGSHEWDSDHPLGELIVCALRAAADSEQVLSYDLLRRPAAWRDLTARQVRAAAIAAINALSEAATLLPSLGPDGVEDFMTSPDRLSGAAIRATDGREGNRAARYALDQHVRRTKPHVMFAVSVALEIASEQAGPSADEDAGQVWDLTTWCWRAAQLRQLSSMLRTAVRNPRAGGEVTAAALDTWSTELAETCRHPVRHPIANKCLAAAAAAALDETQNIHRTEPADPPGPAWATLIAHTERMADLQNIIRNRLDPPPPATATTDKQGNLT